MVDCDHQWNWGKETRFCLKCRQVRIFPNDDKAGRIIWQGIDDKRNLLELSAEDKSILAHLAQDLGVKKAADCLEMPMNLLRVWCGVYCRQAKPKLNESIEINKEVKPKRKYVRKQNLKILSLYQP